MKKRTIQQNKALHLYFNMVAEQLNEIGLEFQYNGLKGMELSVPFTGNVFKDFYWKNVQKVMFDKDSTTQLTTKEINDIIDVFSKYFSEQGIYIEFPSIDGYIDKLNNI